MLRTFQGILPPLRIVQMQLLPLLELSEYTLPPPNMDATAHKVLAVLPQLCLENGVLTPANVDPFLLQYQQAIQEGKIVNRMANMDAAVRDHIRILMVSNEKYDSWGNDIAALDNNQFFEVLQFCCKRNKG